MQCAAGQHPAHTPDDMQLEKVVASCRPTYLLRRRRRDRGTANAMPATAVAAHSAASLR